MNRTSSIAAVIVAAILFTPTDSIAGRLFKCIDASGNTVYQQESCAPSQAQEERSFVREEPPFDVEPSYFAEQAEPSEFASQRPDAQEPRASSAGSQGIYRDRFGAVIDTRSSASEELRRAQIRSSSREGRQINREMYGTTEPQAGDIVPETGLPRGRRYQAPQAAPPATQPTIVTDQHGNRFQRPPGSNIIIDEKTGKQCFLNGSFIQCD